MSGYQPLQIVGNATGLVQSRQEFLLPDDAYPTLINAYVWRERIKRKQGWEKLGRLRRYFNNASLGNSGASPWSFNIYSNLVPPITPEDNATIECGSVTIWISPTSTTGAITDYAVGVVNCVVVAIGHGLTTGTVITISGVTVQPGTGTNEINGGPYTITVVSPNLFALGASSATWGKYLAGGTWSTVSASTNQLVDQGDGTLVDSVGAATGTINYLTGDVTITGGAAAAATTISFGYFPGLPVMGLRTRENETINNEELVAFDTTYAYRIESGGFQEFLPGTTWTGSDSDFFWSTNYWVSDGNFKIFWVTNDIDPIRYTNGQVGTNWINFSPTLDSMGTTLDLCKCMIPFRGRMVVFNTVESGVQRPNRIRWAQIGNPFTVASAIVTTVVATGWRDDIRGKGGFLDIPTSEDIITVGFVRDNLVIFCERSTWQLRYTGRSIAPFQIEKVNSELGVESTFSGVQFDTSLVGIGDKGVVECDSFNSERIDIKIPDLVQSQIQNQNNGAKRVHGIRDIERKLAYWIYPAAESNGIYPDRRLCYNYENDSWSIFTDSLTALGTYQNEDSPKWSDYVENKLGLITWEEADFPWSVQQSEFPNIIGGNQQGYVLYLNQIATNEESLFIKNITGNVTTSTEIESPNHNLKTGQVIKITNIDSSSSFFSTLNDQIFGIVVTGTDTFTLWLYNPVDGQFSTPQLDPVGTYIGCGEIQVRDNFNIVSKKFNYMDQGRQIQIGYIDILMNTTDEGAITLNVYNDYVDPITGSPSNHYPQNSDEDTFFNTTVETTALPFGVSGGEKQWRRVFCPTNSNFVTLEWTLSNAQMIGSEQESDVQIDAQTIWSRVGGRLGITS